jgi:PAS domain S-box-containing protein
MTSLKMANVLLKHEISELKIRLVSSKAQQRDFLQLKRRFKDSEVRFKNIFEQSSFGNKIIDSDLKIIKVNQSLIQLIGYSEAELLGKKITDFAHPDFVKSWKKLQHELWALEKTSFVIEACMIRKDNTCIWCEATSIIFIDNGDLLGYTIIQDVTARKNLEVKLLQQQQNLMEAIINTQEEERRRIAENLHNSLGQMLYAAKIALELIKPQDITKANENSLSIARSKSLLSECIAESRRMSHELMPKVLYDFGLKAALEEVCSQLNGRIKFNCSFLGLPLQPNRHLEIAIYRIVQELMMNVVKHSDGTSALVIVNRQKNTFILVWKITEVASKWTVRIEVALDYKSLKITCSTLRENSKFHRHH